ncbi:MAG: hypothetical protein ACE5F2_01050 [Candidatus Paceibacteria bacterium]
MGKVIKLYDGIDDDLRFLSQVPNEGSLQQSIHNAVNKVYDSIPNPISPLLYSADDIHSETTIDGEYV